MHVGAVSSAPRLRRCLQNKAAVSHAINGLRRGCITLHARSITTPPCASAARYPATPTSTADRPRDASRVCQRTIRHIVRPLRFASTQALAQGLLRRFAARLSPLLRGCRRDTVRVIPGAHGGFSVAFTRLLPRRRARRPLRTARRRLVGGAMARVHHGAAGTRVPRGDRRLRRGVRGWPGPPEVRRMRRVCLHGDIHNSMSRSHVGPSPCQPASSRERRRTL